MTVKSLLAASSLVAGTLAITTGTAADARAAHVTKAPCVAKPVTVNGSVGTQFCGPATATVKVSGKTYSFKDGFCAHDVENGLALQLSLGTDLPVFGSGKPNHGRPLFELTVSTTGGKGSLLATDFASRTLVPDDTQVSVSYSSAPLKGTFHGKAVSGAWNCHGGIYKLNQS